jgi:hypothetical protein
MTVRHVFLLIALSLSALTVFAEDPGNVADNAEADPPAAEQDDVSKALDSTATQWSFQFAWQGSTWKDDEVNGSTRPQGHDDFVQLRVVAPFVFEKFTLLPRLTLRHYKNKNNGKTGLGNTELFGLIIPKKWDWGTGRMGLGPLVTLPGNKDVARDEWGYGLAGAIVQCAAGRRR